MARIAGELPPPAPQLSLTFTVGSNAYPEVVNPARVGSAERDLRRADNVDSDRVDIPPLVDLTVTKTHAGQPAVGGRNSYTVTVGNRGPTDDPGPVTVRDRLPAGTSYVSATGSGWDCAADGQLVTCTRLSGMKVGATSVISVVVDVLPGAYPSIVNTVEVSTPSEDTDPTNNTDTDPATVTPSVDLALTKSLGTTDGDRLTWQVKVTNRGPNDVQDLITVTDTLPAELSYVAAQGPGWTCTAAGQVITCSYPAGLAVRATLDLQVVTTTTAGPDTTVTNTAKVATPHDSDPRTTPTPPDTRSHRCPRPPRRPPPLRRHPAAADPADRAVAANYPIPASMSPAR